MGRGVEVVQLHAASLLLVGGHVDVAENEANVEIRIIFYH